MIECEIVIITIRFIIYTLPALARNMKVTIPIKLALISVVFLSINLFIGYSVYQSFQKLRNSQRWLLHTDVVINQSHLIYSYTKEMQAAGRGFIITNDSAFLKPFWPARGNVLPVIAQLKLMTSDNPIQQRRADSLRIYMEKLCEYASNSINIRSQFGLAAATRYISTKEGESLAAHIQQITNNVQQEELALRQQRLQTNEQSVLHLNMFALITFAVIMLFTIISMAMVASYMFQNRQKERRAAELVIANNELLFQNSEKAKRAAELVVANKELLFQSKEKAKRAAELLIANDALIYQNEEKEKRAAELVIANAELSHQNNEKEKRAAELVIANVELIYQNKEKIKRSAELIIANVELSYQNYEKEKRAAELAIANKVLLASQEIANYGNFKLDYNTGVTFWSDQLCDIFGLSQEDNSQSYKNFLSYIHPDDIDEVLKVTKLNNVTASNVNFYHRIIRKDGSIKHLHTWQRLEFDTSGNAVSMSVVANDITDQKANIIQLKNQNKQLREIAWMQSHEVRGPLSGILGLVYLFKNKEFDVTTDEIMEGIITCSEKLDQVIRGIVDKTVAADILDSNVEI
ncbi:MAG: CHASE3 domain-containing protein [Flavipsychrobacter sp.]|nr:CHASE3 domain-containing protein [Flavipsychrobacter sp.]